MSVIATALHTVHSAAIALSMFIAAETDVEFDETKVTPGPAGFFATAIVGIAVIGLGFMLVRRIRRISVRAEAREAIQAEIDEAEAAKQAGAADSAAPAAPAAPATPAAPTQP